MCSSFDLSEIALHCDCADREEDRKWPRTHGTPVARILLSNPESGTSPVAPRRRRRGSSGSRGSRATNTQVVSSVPITQGHGDSYLSLSRQGPLGHRGPRRDHRRRPAARAPHARLWQRGLRQDALRHGVPRPRGGRARRARRLHVLRGDRGGAGHQRGLAGLRPAPAGQAEAAGHRPRARGAQRDRGDRRVRPRGPVRAAAARHRERGRQARGARHHRIALQLPAQPRHPALGAAAPVPLAQGPGDDHRHHGRAGRGHASPVRGSRSTSPTA